MSIHMTENDYWEAKEASERGARRLCWLIGFVVLGLYLLFGT